MGPIGFPVSTILGSLDKEHIELGALVNIPFSLWRFRYVDDIATHCLAYQYNALEGSMIDPDVQFANEVEQDATISFLDIKTTS